MMNPSDRLDRVLEESGVCGGLLLVWHEGNDDEDINYAFSRSPDARDVPVYIAMQRAMANMLEGMRCTCGSNFGENRLGRR